MKRFLSLSSAFLILQLLLPSLAAGASSSSGIDGLPDAAGQCRRQVNVFLQRERSLFDMRLFGVKLAQDEPEGATRMAVDGTLFLKTGKSTWASGTQMMSDEEMDRNTVRDPLPLAGQIPQNPPYPGLLETQRALTSDLLPPLLQNFRAFQCRMASICEAAFLALRGGNGDGATVKIAVPGCREMELPTMNLCAPNPMFTYLDPVTLRSYCSPVAADLTRFEESQLRFLAHEDAAQRTLRQFAGYLEPFLNLVRFPFLQPLRQVASFLGQWSDVPCFLSHCAQEP